MRGLDGKTAIIAGGSTLIGQVVAELLVGYGANIVIADINVADGEATAKKLGSKGRFIRCDLCNDADIAALVTYERNSFGNQTGDVVQPSAVKATRTK